ncbi:MAG TPA: HEAT repeat domain-containing protein [Urbifossiella sp.]|nr:HEAT repeat domain-containing protein [Urbifossiella sp.]
MRFLGLMTAFGLTLAVPARADEPDDLLAKQLAAVVRDPRLPLPQRVEAAKTIGKLGPRAGAAVPDLTTQLLRLRGNELEPLQEAVIDALGRIGSPARESLPAVARAAGRSPDLDQAIKRATGTILASTDSQDVGALVKQLQSGDPSFRLRAVKALGAIGPAARFALPDLANALRDSDGDVRRAAVAALQLIAPEARPSEAVVRAIALDLRDPDPSVRLLAVRSLGRFGRAAAVVAGDLEPLLTDPDTDVRRAATEILPRISGP